MNTYPTHQSADKAHRHLSRGAPQLFRMHFTAAGYPRDGVVARANCSGKARL